MYLGDLCLSDNSLGQFVGLWHIYPALDCHEGFFYCDLGCFGGLSSQRGGTGLGASWAQGPAGLEQAEPSSLFLQDAVSLWVQLGSAAAHGGPVLGKGDGRICIPQFHCTSPGGTPSDA